MLERVVRFVQIDHWGWFGYGTDEDGDLLHSLRRRREFARAQWSRLDSKTC